MILIALIGYNTAAGQTIEIGMDANQVKQMIQWSTRDRTGYDSYGNSKGNNVAWDVKYFNGQISEVIQCYTNQYLLDFRITASFCKRYVMEKGVLSYILTQYENVSTEALKAEYGNDYSAKRIGDFYFSDDYQHYSKIYLAQNGLATVAWRKTEVSTLPANIKQSVQKQLAQKQTEETKRQQAKKSKERREKEIKSKTYDLAIYDSVQYKNLVAEFLKSAERTLKSNSMFPDFEAIRRQEEKFFVFKNTYAVYYKLVDHSRESVDHGYYIEAGSIDIRNENKYTLISGSDNDCRFIKKVPFYLPTIYVEDIKVMTEAKIAGINVEYVKGITKAKVKNGVVTFVKDAPALAAQEKFVEQLKNEPNGANYIKYEVGRVMDKAFVTVDK